jgi:hypothetical protein
MSDHWLALGALRLGPRFCVVAGTHQRAADSICEAHLPRLRGQGIKGF